MGWLLRAFVFMRILLCFLHRSHSLLCSFCDKHLDKKTKKHNCFFYSFLNVYFCFVITRGCVKAKKLMQLRVHGQGNVCPVVVSRVFLCLKSRSDTERHGNLRFPVRCDLYEKSIRFFISFNNGLPWVVAAKTQECHETKTIRILSYVQSLPGCMG